MSKVTLVPIPDPVADPAGFVTAYNANLTAIELAFANTVSRDGSEPNSIDTNLDFGDNQIVNGLVTPPPPYFLTSRLYPLEDLEAFSVSIVRIKDSPSGYTLSAHEASFTILSGTLTLNLENYTHYPIEGYDGGTTEVVSGELDTVLLTYSNYDPEGFEAGTTEVTSGELDVVLITYLNYPPEAFDYTLTIISGTLT